MLDTRKRMLSPCCHDHTVYVIRSVTLHGAIDKA